MTHDFISDNNAYLTQLCPCEICGEISESEASVWAAPLERVDDCF